MIQKTMGLKRFFVRFITSFMLALWLSTTVSITFGAGTIQNHANMIIGMQTYPFWENTMDTKWDHWVVFQDGSGQKAKVINNSLVKLNYIEVPSYELSEHEMKRLLRLKNNYVTPLEPQDPGIEHDGSQEQINFLLSYKNKAKVIGCSPDRIPRELDSLRKEIFSQAVITEKVFPPSLYAYVRPVFGKTYSKVHDLSKITEYSLKSIQKAFDSPFTFIPVRQEEIESIKAAFNISDQLVNHSRKIGGQNGIWQLVFFQKK